MDFDDRLREHMHRQSDELTITPEGLGAVETRSRRRRQRRSAALVVTAVLAVAGIGAIVSNQSGPSEVRVAAPDDEAADTAQASAADAASESSFAQPGTDDIPGGQVLTGSALELSDTANDLSPGGFNIWNNTFDDGIYYVLSTAPGKTYEDYQREGNFEGRPDTLYAWDGDSWQVREFGDRYINELLSDDGVLYTVSTGSPSGPDLAVGSSTDQGQTWVWTSLDPASNTPQLDAFRTVSAAGEGRVLVVRTRQDQPDWNEAIQLANDAGLDIDPETSDILNIDFHGIEWFEGGYEPLPVGPCTAASNEFYMEREEEFAQSAPPFYPEEEFADLTPEQQAKWDVWQAEQDVLSSRIEAERIEMLRGIEGCEEYVQCTIDTNALSEDIDERIEAIFADVDGEPTAEQFAAADKLWVEFEAFYEQSGCNKVFSEGFVYEEGEDTEPQYVSWEELGVTVPDSWRGSADAYVLADGVVDELPTIDPPGGFLTRAEVTGDGYRLTYDTSFYEYDGEASRSNTVLTTDGSTGWVAAESTEPVHSLEAPPRVGEYTFDVVWETNGSSLLRTDGAGNVVRLSVDNLAGDLGTANYELFAAAGGEYGVVAWAMSFGGGETSYEVDSMLFYSDDGESWGATALPGLSINDVLVGESEALVFTSNPELANSGEAQPIFRAKLG